MKTLQELEAKHRELVNGLATGKRDKEILSELKKVQAEIMQVKIKSKLGNVNRNQARLREYAKQAWECEVPTEDITTNDGSFHKVKVKKYPNLAALKYAYATFENGKMTRLNINGEKFSMYSTKYEYNKPNEYTRPETFGDFLSLNNIKAKDITIEELTAVVEASKALTEKAREYREEISNEYKKLDMYSLSNLGLFSQDHETIYTYRINY